MSTPIRTPKLGVAVTEGEISDWLVADGESVEAGQAIDLFREREVATEIESPASGTIRIIGEVYAVGTLVAEVE